jgi:hypothetical protein
VLAGCCCDASSSPCHLQPHWHTVPACRLPHVCDCSRRPECKMFVAYAKCCQGGGILAAGSSLRMWLVCNRDVYLPAPKCLTGGLPDGKGRGYVLCAAACRPAAAACSILVLQGSWFCAAFAQLLPPTACLIPPACRSQAELQWRSAARSSANKARPAQHCSGQGG